MSEGEGDRQGTGLLSGDRQACLLSGDRQACLLSGDRQACKRKGRPVRGQAGRGQAGLSGNSQEKTKRSGCKKTFLHYLFMEHF